MQKDDLVYVGHMLDTARLIVGKVKGLSRSDFDADDNLCLALTHLIQTIGEAARRVSPAFQSQHSDIPGRRSSECATKLCMTTCTSIIKPCGRWQP